LIRSSDTPAPNGFEVTRIATDEAFDPGLKLHPGSQITQTYTPLYEPFCLADFNRKPTVPAWLRQSKAALLAPLAQCSDPLVGHLEDDVMQQSK
jgi:hypothetical protein